MGPTIEDAKALLSSICAQHRANHAGIAEGVNGKQLYAFDVLSWVERFDPNASLALCLAALFHDIDSVVNPKMDEQRLHALRSAQFIIPVLSEMGFPAPEVVRTEFLISHHDDTATDVERIADPELNQLVSADSFAFLTSIAPKLLAVEGTDQMRKTIRFMVDKLPEPARAELWEHRLDDGDLEGLKNEVVREYYLEHSPRERAYKYCPTCQTALGRKSMEGVSLLTCVACGFVFWNPPSLVTSVIIERGPGVLLIRRAARPLQGYWCLPGGFIQYSETPETAAIREVKEETGLDVRVDRLAGIYQIDNAPGGFSLDIIWKGSVTGGSLRTNQESTEAGYFDRCTLPPAIAYKHRQAIHDTVSRDR